MNWLFYTIIQGTNEETHIQSGMELHTEAVTNNLLKMGIFCDGLVTKKTFWNS